MFCLAPFMAMYAMPDRVKVCCSSEEEIRGDFETIYDVWNHEYYRNIRKAFLDGEIPSNCTNCIEGYLKGDSCSQYSTFLHYDYDLAQCDEDGRIDKVVIQKLDVGLSNLCNYGCRTCNSHYSTTKGKIDHSLGLIDTVELHMDKGDRFLSNVVQSQKVIHEMYIYGGNAMHDYGFTKFAKLLESRVKKLIIHYNGSIVTNNRTFDYLDSFRKIGNVRFLFSIDGDKSVSEYIRIRSDQELIYNNMRTLIAQDDHLHKFRYCVQFTISNVSVWALGDMFMEIYSQDWDVEILFSAHFVLTPYHYTVANMPHDMRKKLIAKMLNDAEVIRELFPAVFHLYNIAMYTVFERLVVDEFNESVWQEFKTINNTYDGYTGTRLTDVLPVYDGYI